MPFALLQKKDPDRYRYLLWFKFIIINLLFVTVFMLAVFHGWVDYVFAKDPKIEWFSTLITFNVQTTYVSMIVGVFLFGLFISIQKVFLTSWEINAVKQKNPDVFSRTAEYLAQVRGAESGSRMISLELLWEKWLNRLVIIRYLSNTLMLLGLIGTVIGFVIALGGVKPDLADDISAIGPMVTTLVTGMSVALYTTVAGSFLGGLWLSANDHILNGGAVDFLTLLGERGEREIVS